VLNPSSAPDVAFAIRRSRRNGIDRLFLVGALDRSSVLMLEGELDAVGLEGGLVLDLRELTSIDRWGLHTLERVARRSDPAAPRPNIVNGHGAVLEAFEAAGMGDLLGGTDVSDLLDSGDAERTPISLPPLPGRRVGGRLEVAEERP
jgi:anti-anti-sigma regulatory factor